MFDEDVVISLNEFTTQKIAKVIINLVDNTKRLHTMQQKSVKHFHKNYSNEIYRKNWEDMFDSLYN